MKDLHDFNVQYDDFRRYNTITLVVADHTNIYEIDWSDYYAPKHRLNYQVG